MAAPNRLKSEFEREWRWWLAHFTPAMRARYDELLASRTVPVTDEHCADAVDVVMREPAGGCCGRCNGLR